MFNNDIQDSLKYFLLADYLFFFTVLYCAVAMLFFFFPFPDSTRDRQQFLHVFLPSFLPN